METIFNFRKKPVCVDAFQWTGDFDALDKWLVSLGEDTADTADDGPAMWPTKDGALEIGTLEGEIRCEVGGYVIRGAAGEYYPNNDPEFFRANNTQTGPNRYVKNPVEVEAVLISNESMPVLKERFGLNPCQDHSRSHEAYADHAKIGEGIAWWDSGGLMYVNMKTEYGTFTGDKGDWAITDPKGGTRFCKPDIFEQSYEPITPASAAPAAAPAAGVVGEALETSVGLLKSMETRLKAAEKENTTLRNSVARLRKEVRCAS